MRRLARALNARLVETEGLRAATGGTDAFDLVLRAKSLEVRGLDSARAAAAEALYEQALAKDPQSVPAMTGLVNRLVSRRILYGGGVPGDIGRAAGLAAAAEALRPNHPDVIEMQAFVQRARGQWADAIASYRRVIEADPNTVSAYGQLAVCYLNLGQPDRALPLIDEAMRRDPRDPQIWTRHSLKGQALLGLEQPAEAIRWLRQADARNPGRDEPSSTFNRMHLVSALAHDNQPQAARRELSGLLRLEPALTARMFEARPAPTPAKARQNRYIAAGLRQAGLRDHVDEDADTGVASSAGLHEPAAGADSAYRPGRRNNPHGRPATADAAGAPRDPGRLLPRPLPAWRRDPRRRPRRR